MSAEKAPKKVQIVKEEESFDAPPLDFSFKSIKDFRHILFEEPRKGKRKPIPEEEKKEEKNKKEQKVAEENKKSEEKEVTEPDQQTIASTEGEKKNETEKNEEEGNKQKEKEEVTKQAPDKINIIPETHIQNLMITNNHTLHTISKAPGGKAADDNKLHTKQVKVNLVCVSLILSYNEIRSLDNMYDIINKVMYNCEKLSWIDLSHNYLITLPEEIKRFEKLRTLNIHCNYIHDLTELKKLQPLENLRGLTIHGNPLDLIPNFRLYIIGMLPQLQKLDTVLISKKEKDNANVFINSFKHIKFPKLNPKEITKPPEPIQNKQNEQAE